VSELASDAAERRRAKRAESFWWGVADGLEAEERAGEDERETGAGVARAEGVDGRAGVVTGVEVEVEEAGRTAAGPATEGCGM
jgi:hypothetical protein